MKNKILRGFHSFYFIPYDIRTSIDSPKVSNENTPPTVVKNAHGKNMDSSSSDSEISDSQVAELMVSTSKEFLFNK